jgi:hypothetical protein
MAIKPIEILIKAKDEASGILGSVQAKVAAVAVAIAAYFSVTLFKGAVTSAAELDVQMRKLDGVIAATGGAAGLTAIEIDTMARRLDEATLGSAAGFRDAAAQLLTFKSVGKDAFETTLMLAQDLADAGFGSVTANAVQLGKALEDPVQGLSALTRSGVTFTEQQQEVIKSLMETGRHAEAQALILEAVAGQVGGVATAMGGGLAGAVDLAGKRFTDLKEKLGKAVLPVFAEFNNKLAELYKRLTDDGTVSRFGEAIAKGFQAALDWGLAFLAQVDFDAIGQKATALASRTGEAFDAIGQYARNAGDIVRLVWGVMSAGSNAVLAAVYTVGTAFAGVASNIQSGIALIFEAFAKITPGVISDSYKLAAEEIRLSAEATGAASEALGEKAREAFLGMSDGAQLARNGWAGLTTEVEKASTTTEVAAGSLEALVEELQAAEAASDAAAQATTDKAAADENARLAVIALRTEVEAYKREYEAALAAGNVQLAVEKLEQIQQALQKTSGQAKVTADEVKAAFVLMGISTEKELTAAAAKSKAAFIIVKDSGQATAEGVQQSFKKMADAAIASGDAGAIAFAKSQAAANGYTIAVDASGKATLVANDANKKAGDIHNNTAGTVEKHRTALERLNDARDREISALEKANSLKERADALERKRLGVDKQGFAADSDGNRITQLIPTKRSVFENAKSQGLTEAQSLELSDQFIDERGRQTGWAGADFNAGENWGTELEKAIDKLVFQNARTGKPATPQNPAVDPRNPSGTAAKAAEKSALDERQRATAKENVGATPLQRERPTPATTFISNITLPGAGTTRLSFSDANSQREAEALMRQILAARGASS